MRLLYFFSKTDRSIIRHCPSSAKNVHATLGFFVLMTGVMAFISGSYAISNMFIHEDPVNGQPKLMPNGGTYSILLGAVYATFIMAIDREIVSATTRWAAAIRIPLAIVISFVVSVPVELQIFEARINKQLRQQGQQENDILLTKLDGRVRIQKLESNIARLDSLKLEAIKSRDYWSDMAQAELAGRVKAGSTGIPGPGTAYAGAVENKIIQDTAILKYESELVQKRDELKEAKLGRDILFQNQRIPQSYDLLSKYIALKEVKRDDKTGSASAIIFGITVLFCLFELIPSIMKLVTPRTEYDAVLDNRRRLNIYASRMIYEKAKMEYESMTEDQVRDYNPVAVQKIYESQAV